MDLGSILLIFAILIPVALFIAKPLLERQATFVSEEEQEISALLAERDRILDSVQELDFDYKLGKIPDADYPLQRTVLLQRGTRVLKQLDRIQGLPESSSQLETAAAGQASPALAQNGPPVRAQLPDDDIETLIAARRRERREKSSGFCPQCGHAVLRSDRFCSNCGQVL